MIATTETSTAAGIGPVVAHHRAAVNDTELHYVTAGDSGSPLLLVHGFPESWWAFRSVIPLLAAHHQVVAVDLRGFGDSSVAGRDHDSRTAAEDLHQLVAHLGLGPVHLLAQDISGGTAYRLATEHPEDVLSLTAVEMGLAGFGLEALADVAHGGSWHIGLLAGPVEVVELLMTGHEHELLGSWAFPTMSVVEGAIGPSDVEEMSRGFARPGGWRGAMGLYRSMMEEGEGFRRVAAGRPIEKPTLAVGAGGGAFTAMTLSQVAAGKVESVQLEGVGHYAAQEAPEEVAGAVLRFLAGVDAR